MEHMETFYLLFGLLQTIILGLGAWSLLTIMRMQTRMTKVETLLESSIIGDVVDLKSRVRLIEDKCRVGCMRHE